MIDGLEQKEIESYKETGYLLVKNLFDKSEVNYLLEAIQEILENNSLQSVAEIEPENPSAPRRIWSPTKRSERFNVVARSSKLLDRIESLIGPNILFHYSKLNMKAPKVGSVVEWHQDFSFYPHTNTDLLSCLIYLDDADISNGCLEVIPGSHKQGILNHCIDGFFRGKLNSESLPIDLEKAQHLEAPAGSVIFLHCLTVHGSKKNLSDKPRRAFLPAYRAADAYPIYFGPHASHNEPGVTLLRGKQLNVARTEASTWSLPIAAANFSSLYELQEGAHTKEKKQTKVGYYAEIKS